MIITGGYYEHVYDSTATVNHYNHSTRVWSELPAMLIPRTNHQCVTLMNPLRVMVIGDGTDASEPCEIYDVTRKKWSLAAPCLTRQLFPVCVVYENKVYAFAAKACEVYDEKKDNWSLIASKPTPRGLSSGVVVGGGAILVLGGSDLVDVIEEYTPVTDKWRTISWKLPHPHYRFGVSYNCTTSTLMMCGGRRGPSNHAKNVYIRSEPFESNKWLCSKMTFKADIHGYC
jgi:hypothetical protein